MQMKSGHLGQIPDDEYDHIVRLAKVIDEAMERHIITEGYSVPDGFAIVMNALVVAAAEMIGRNMQPDEVGQAARKFARQIEHNAKVVSRAARRERERPMMKIVREENLAPLQITREIVHEIAVKHAEEWFALEGEAPFLWIVAHDRTRLTWIETPWTSRTEKVAAVEMMRSRMKTLGAHCYAHMGEAWTSSEASDKQIEMGKTKLLPPRLRDAKDRDDIMFVESWDHDGAVARTHWLVTLRTGNRNLLGPRMEQEYLGDANLGGLMWNLLKEPESNHIS